MSLSFRPRSHAERDQIVSAILSYLARPDADAALVAAEASVFADTRAAYQSARASYQSAAGALDDAGEAADAADADFDRAFRLFVASVRDAEGRPAPRTIADGMGGMLPGELVGRPYREEVQRTRDLLSRLGSKADLDADRLGTLTSSVEALETATDASEAATRAAHSAGAALTEAVLAFDQRYGKLVRRWQGLSEEGVVEGILPRFVRVERKAADTEAPDPTP